MDLIPGLDKYKPTPIVDKPLIYNKEKFVMDNNGLYYEINGEKRYISFHEEFNPYDLLNKTRYELIDSFDVYVDKEGISVFLMINKNNRYREVHVYDNRRVRYLKNSNTKFSTLENHIGFYHKKRIVVIVEDEHGNIPDYKYYILGYGYANSYAIVVEFPEGKKRYKIKVYACDRDLTLPQYKPNEMFDLFDDFEYDNKTLYSKYYPVDCNRSTCFIYNSTMLYIKPNRYHYHGVQTKEEVFRKINFKHHVILANVFVYNYDAPKIAEYSNNAVSDWRWMVRDTYPYMFFVHFSRDYEDYYTWTPYDPYHIWYNFRSPYRFWEQGFYLFDIQYSNDLRSAVGNLLLYPTRFRRYQSRSLRYGITRYNSRYFGYKLSILGEDNGPVMHDNYCIFNFDKLAKIEK